MKDVHLRLEKEKESRFRCFYLNCFFCIFSLGYQIVSPFHQCEIFVFPQNIVNFFYVHLNRVENSNDKLLLERWCDKWTLIILKIQIFHNKRILWWIALTLRKNGPICYAFIQNITRKFCYTYFVTDYMLNLIMIGET